MENKGLFDLRDSPILSTITPQGFS